MRGDKDLKIWAAEMSSTSRRVQKDYKRSLLINRVRRTAGRHPLVAIGLCGSTLAFSLSILHNATADASTHDHPVEEVSTSIIPSDYNKSSALITGLTPLSRTNAERVVAEIGCNSKGNVTYTLLSGYEAPDGTTSEVNTSASALPNPCEGDFSITPGETNEVLAIAKAVGLLDYQRN